MKQGPSFATKKGTLIALACGAAFAAPYAAADPLRLDGHALTIQGNIAAGLGRQRASGASANNSDTVARNVISTGESNFRLSASSKTTDSFFTAYGFAMENAVSLDSGGGTYAGRNTGMGVMTTAGAFTFGNWDTAFKEVTSKISVIGSGKGLSGATSGIIQNIGMGSGTGGAVTGGGTLADSTNFNRRQTNSFNYYSPTFSNTYVQLTYSPDEQTGAGVVPSARARLYGASIFYNDGPLSVNYGYEQHQDFLWGSNIIADTMFVGSAAAGAGTTSTDYGHELIAIYTFGNTTISGGLFRLKWSQSGGATVLQDLTTDQWTLGLIQKIGGPHEFRISYSSVGSYKCTPSTACGTETGATDLKLSYGYYIAKNTTINLTWVRLSNDRQGAYKVAAGPATVTAGSASNPAGLTYTSYGINVSSSF